MGGIERLVESVCAADGAIVEGKMDEGMDGVMEGDEGEGWDVGDELELPPDLVRSMVVVETIVYLCFSPCRCQTWVEEVWVEKDTMFPPPREPVRHR